MTDFTERAAELDIEPTEFMWKLIRDMAETIDILVSQTEPKPTEDN